MLFIEMWCSSVIDIWCVKVGDKYRSEHVDNLHRMVDKNLSRPYRFNCLTQSKFDGWWAKIDLLLKDGPAIYFDLDVVIVDEIDSLARMAETNTFSMAKNWANSGHGGWQSSVMLWSNERENLHAGFDYSRVSEATGPENCRNFGWYIEESGVRHWGDQEWLTYNAQDVTEIPAGLVVSYKYHCRGGLPDRAKVVCFHGKPDYWEVSDPWIKQALS